MSTRPIIAAFDFDHTLTTRDSLIPLLMQLQGRFKAITKLIYLSPYLIGFKIHLLSRQQIKEQILTAFLKGMPLKQFQEIGQQYADNQLDQFIKPEALERLRWHQKQHHRCILISASLENYLLPWAKRHHFQDVLASRLEIIEPDYITGKLAGINCWGPEKTRRLTELLGPKENYTLYAYGDSRGDTELLELADFPFYRTFS